MSELFPDRIETERLRLEHESPADADLYERYRHLSTDAVDPEAFEYIPVSPHEHPHDTAEMLASRHERWTDGIGATYVVRPKDSEEGASEARRASDSRAGDARESGPPAGEAELLADWEARSAYFAFGLRKRFWGRGYSGERAAALVSLAFDRLDLEVVSVTHLVENENSRRAVERYVDRFGGRREGTIRNQITLDGEPVDTVRYSISRAEYEASDPDRDHTFHDD
ncbi:GNAT family N-acetyltransferase [Haloarchaeobius baliensis]|uniref:GNAT family N-acetyltransferase n=1 Tax=Haloarchaeobius baliensis TaxID=1670458 RepID=UPI003F88321D